MICGRLIAFEFQYDGNNFVIINIYGSNIDDISIHEQVIKFLAENEDKHLILGGDFNTILDPTLDIKKWA